MNNLGYSQIWDNFDPNMNYSGMLRRRLRDQFMQTWRDLIYGMPKLNYYNKMKTNFEFENYLKL